MAATSASAHAKIAKAAYAILWAGLIAGILDITAAIVTNALRGIKPIRILQSVASGLLGADSYQGGLKTAAFGLALHFLIATGAAAVYYVVSTRFRVLLRQAIISGLIYGVVVYLFMSFVVLPLSAFPHRGPVSLSVRITGVIVHMLCVGLPISLVIRRFSR